MTATQAHNHADQRTKLPAQYAPELSAHWFISVVHCVVENGGKLFFQCRKLAIPPFGPHAYHIFNEFDFQQIPVATYAFLTGLKAHDKREGQQAQFLAFRNEDD